MSKSISESSLPPLWRAREENRRLEEENAQLKKEVARLKRENARLKGTKVQERHSALFQCPGSSHTTPGRFARPTASSRGKAKSLANEDTESGAQSQGRSCTDDITMISGKKYIYHKGVPTRVTNTQPLDWYYDPPHYMNKTEASESREEEISYAKAQAARYDSSVEGTGLGDWYPLWDSRWYVTERPNDAKRKEAWQKRHQPSDNGHHPSSWWVDRQPIKDPSPEPLSTTPCSGGVKRDLMGRATRLDDYFSLHFERTIYLDCGTNLKHLKRAMHLVQESLVDAARDGAFGWRRDQFKAGPEFVRLGRDEILRWAGERIDGSYKEVAGYTLHYDLMCVVSLRNAICHPEGYLLVHGDEVDRLLSLAQKVTVSLSDEARSLEIRRMRDDLIAAGRESRNELLAAFALRSLPHQEEVKYAFHQIVQLREAELKAEYGMPDPEVLTAAQEWKDSMMN